MPWRRRIVDEIWDPPTKAPREAKACRKSTLRRIAQLADRDKTDVALIKANCRTCGSCWLAEQ